MKWGFVARFECLCLLDVSERYRCIVSVVIVHFPRSSMSNTDVAPCAMPVDEMRCRMLIEDMELKSQQLRILERQHRAATLVQRVARMFLTRRRFMLHNEKLQRERFTIRERRTRHAVLVIQKVARGLFARRLLKSFKVAWITARQEAARKGVKGKASGKGSVLAYDTLQSNINFVNGVKAYLLGRFDDALQLLDAQVKIFPDVVTTRMIEIVKRKQQNLPIKGPAATAAPIAKKKK